MAKPLIAQPTWGDVVSGEAPYRPGCRCHGDGMQGVSRVLVSDLLDHRPAVQRERLATTVLIAWRIRSSARSCASSSEAPSSQIDPRGGRPPNGGRPPRGLLSPQRELPAAQRLDRERADLDHGELEALRGDVGPQLDVDLHLLAPVEDERPGA
jgi:hypothetical protein